MTNTLRTPKVQAVLERLFEAAAHDRSVGQDPAASALEQAEANSGVYMPISASGGELLYSLVRAIRPGTIVEFGTSYGISTLYLAAAVRDNGIGAVLSTELSERKIDAARANLAEAGLDGQATILAGDARETLSGVSGPIGLVLLDGWKDLCLPVLRALEPELAPGALVIGDDSSFASMADYLRYVRAPENGYVSVPFPVEDGMEISCFTGR
ncbi:O-methyltransferase [Sciscionella marina]|uniref:O-methyltransferase n=1 Tax=Sciscionella marina TaxID=508770 RepID=UPI00036864E0|nr:class I SAM-dependent methyltransferase [Sciscionella marina]